MSTDGQGTKCRRKIAENYNRLSRVHECYTQTDDGQTTDRQTTDGRVTAYNERDREFTFAKNRCTDRDAVWVVDSGGPKEACIRRESRSPLKGQLLGERGGPLSA